jgi:hypothetical protein
MEIKRIFVFENTARVFRVKNKYSKDRKSGWQIGYPICVWKLTNKDSYKWVALEHLGVFRSMNMDKKRLFASALRRAHGCQIVYLKGERTKFIKNDLVLYMAFRKGDI